MMYAGSRSQFMMNLLCIHIRISFVVDTMFVLNFSVVNY